MRELEEEFAESIVAIGVHSAKFPAEKEPASLQAAVRRLDIHHPVVNDGDMAVWQAFAVRAWPTLMFIDPRGRVIGKHEGEFELASMRDFLQEAIASFREEGSLVPSVLAGATESELDTGELRFPGKILADQQEGRLFIADSGHQRVVETDLDGRIRRVVGSGEPGRGDGLADRARFNEPQGMALSDDGTTLYVADRANHALRAVDLATGGVTTVAGTGERARERTGGPGTETALASPWDLVLIEGLIWIAMAGTHQLWTFDSATGRVEPRAGSGAEALHDGPLATAAFNQPSGVAAIDGQLYVADSEASAVRRVDLASDRVRRLVGRGLFEFGDVDARGDSVRLQHPLGIVTTREEGRVVLYLADTYNDKIKRLDPETREVETVLGGAGHGCVDGTFEEAELWEPGGLSLAGRQLYIADTNNHAVRVADLDAGTVRTLEVRGQ